MRYSASQEQAMRRIENSMELFAEGASKEMVRGIRNLGLELGVDCSCKVLARTPKRMACRCRPLPGYKLQELSGARRRSRSRKRKR